MTQILHTTPSPAGKGTSNKESRRALVSSFLGSTVEYYDFLLYASAAGLVFPYLFFPETMDPAVAPALSFVLLLAGYIARPLGGVLFGHFGDQFRRCYWCCCASSRVWPWAASGQAPP